MAHTVGPTFPGIDIDSADTKPGGRSSPRIRTTFRIARVLADADQGLAHLCDISDDGVGLRLYMSVRLGTPS